MSSSAYSNVITAGDKGMGDVVGPASSVTSNITIFADTSGKLIADSGVSIFSLGDVSANSISVDGNIPKYSGITGQVIEDSGINVTELGDVVGPVSANDDFLAAFDGITGKLLKDSLININGVGDTFGPLSSVNDSIVLFQGTSGKNLIDSGVKITELGDVTGPGSSVSGNLPTFSNTTGKDIIDSGKAVADVGDVFGATASTNQNIPMYSGPTGLVIQDSNINVNDLGDVQGPASSGDHNIVIYNGLTGKLLEDSGVTIGDITPVSRQVITGAGTFQTNGDTLIEVRVLSTFPTIELSDTGAQPFNVPITVFDSLGSLAPSNTVTVVIQGGGTINGETSFVLDCAYGAYTFTRVTGGGFVATTHPIPGIVLSQESTLGVATASAGAASSINFGFDFTAGPPPISFVSATNLFTVNQAGLYNFDAIFGVGAPVVIAAPEGHGIQMTVNGLTAFRGETFTPLLTTLSINNQSLTRHMNNTLCLNVNDTVLYSQAIAVPGVTNTSGLFRRTNSVAAWPDSPTAAMTIRRML